jgi:hypothetical protein
VKVVSERHKVVNRGRILVNIIFYLFLFKSALNLLRSRSRKSSTRIYRDKDDDRR